MVETQIHTQVFSDRAWGPERPIFGKVRYMSSESAMRKLKLKNYLERYAKEETMTLAKFG